MLNRTHQFSFLREVPLISQTLPKFGGLEAPTDSIYLDYASATPVEDSVYLEGEAWHRKAFANPANRLHMQGEYAEHALMDARKRVAASIGAAPEEICFTSSATEANNLALRGLVLHPKRKRKRIVYSPSDHSSVVETLKALSQYALKETIELVPLKLDAQGIVDLEDARQKITDQTLCVSVMDVNNETGVIQSSLAEVINIAHEHGALVHVDAVQGFARNSFRVDQIFADMAVISSGKIYGPKGIAALYLRQNTGSSAKLRLAPQLTGGGQENGLRSSTQNVAAARSFARACELICCVQPEQWQQMLKLEELFIDALRKELDVQIYGEGNKIPGILMMSIPQTNAMKLAEHCKTLCLSAGSACRTLQATASHVLLAMGVPVENALGSFRASFGIPTTQSEVLQSAELIIQSAKKLRPK